MFLYCETKPVTFEKRGSSFTADELKDTDIIHDNEIVQVFLDGKEPVSIMDVPHSLLNVLSNKVLMTHRLYVAAALTDTDLNKIRSEVAQWDA